MTGLRDLVVTRRRHRLGEVASRDGGRDAVVLARDDERRRRDGRQRLTQVGLAQHSEPRRERARVRLAVGHQLRAQQAQRLRGAFVAPGLQRQEVRDRPAVIAREAGRKTLQDRRRHAARPVLARHEARRRRDQHQGGEIRRPATREFERDHATERPAEHSGAAWHARRDEARQVGELPDAFRPAAAAVAGEIQQVQPESGRQAVEPRAPHAAVQPPAVQQHEIGPRAANFAVDVVAHARAAGSTTP